MVSHDAPITINKRGGNQAKNPNSEKCAAVPADDELNYGIELLNLGKNSNDSEYESESEK